MPPSPCNPPLCLVLLAACSASFVPVQDSDEPDERLQDSEGQVGDSDPQGGDPGGEPEQVPGLDTGAPTTMCQLELACAQSIVDDPKVPCDFTVQDGEGATWYQGTAGLELRGRSSLGFPKHQYGAELWDALNESVQRDLLGMGAESDWVINGAWIDRALLRNHLAFALYKGFDQARYAPDSHYCTLTLDQVWSGIYFLTERPKVAAGRLDLDEEAVEQGLAFVAKLDDSGGIQEHSSVGYGSWVLVAPRQEEASAAAIAQVQAWLQGWQAALVADDSGDPESGVFAWLDMDSAVDFVLLQELVKNNDAYYLSVYGWKDREGLMHLSPWDLDLSLGQPLYNNNATHEEWIAYRPTWISRMADVPGFSESLAERWFELRQGLLAEDALLERVESYRALMGDEVYDNFEVWPFDEIQFSSDQLPVRESFDEEYAHVLSWIPQRLAWVDEHVESW